MISILAFAILFIPILLLPTDIENGIIRIIVTILGLFALFGLLFYFTYARLNVTSKNGILHFDWQRKIIFNYSKIQDIKIDQITRLVIDQGQILRKIFTNDQEITFGHNRPNNFMKSDSQEFIKFLKTNTDSIKVVDSWDIWIEKGYLKWAFRINTVLLILIIGLLTFTAVAKGFDKIPPGSFFLLIFLLPQLFLYQKQMKNKIKN